jgi:tetratricopeptide (TPR) repeat protein
VKRKLTNTSQAWLLVFDNADDPELSLTPYLPAGDRGDIIITSRNPGCKHYNTVGSREVGRLSVNDSVSLLTKMISGATSPSQSAAEEYKKVVAALGSLALAIVQAGAYIRETSCTAQDYLDIYYRRRLSLLQDLPKHLGTDYRYSVYTTWQVSVDTIESRQDTVSRQTLRLLHLLGFYHYDQVPAQMFYNAGHQAQTLQNTPDYLPWHEADFFDYRQSVQASVSLLASFSLVGRNSDTSLSLHPLVHEWCRDRIGEDEQRLNYQRALLLLTSSVEWQFETGDYNFRRSLLTHVHELLRLRKQQSELGEEVKMQAWPSAALILGENGWIGAAVQLLEEVLTLHKSKLGEDHPDTLSSMHNLAIRYSEAGRRTEALALSEQVWQLYKSKLGEDHPDTLGSMQLVAYLADLSQESSTSTAREHSRLRISRLWQKLRP